jgi:hypothetical protein
MKRGNLAAAIVAVLSVFALVSATVAAGADEDQNLIRKGELKALSLPSLDPADLGGASGASGVGPGQQGRKAFYCGPFGEAGRGFFDEDISCDDPIAPDNETPIAVNPANPNMLLAGSNDYQLNFMGNTVNEQVPSGWMLSQDGGATWIDGNLPLKGDLGGGDPSPGFDVKRNRAVFASLSFVCGQLARFCSRGNVMFATADLSNLSNSSGDILQWSDQTIANGSGSDTAQQQIFQDKEWVAVDNFATLPGGRPNPNYGNYYVFFAQFRTEHLRYDESPIMFTMSSDGGQRWTLPVEVSGRNPAYCTFQDDANDPDTDSSSTGSTQANAETADDPNACDQDEFVYPAVAPDGTLYAQFDNEQNSSAYETPQRYDSQVMLIKSTDGGKTFQGEQPTAANQAGCVRVPQQAAGTPTAGYQNPCIVPIHIVNKEDSYDTTTHGSSTPFPDYPINVDGSTTLTGHQFRVNSAGTIAIGPYTGSPTGYRIWTVWDDNCAGVRPGPGQTRENPGSLPGGSNFVPVTNINVYYAFSDDGGATWVGGDQGGVSCAGRLQVNNDHADDDQWFPWAAANPVTGALSVGYMDESAAAVPAHTPIQYLFSVQTAAASAMPVFSPAVTVASAPSNPNTALFHRAHAVDCPDCSTFIGDYNGLAVGSDGATHSTWTDMRRNAAAPFPTRAVQDLFYARIPPPGS